MYVCILDTAGQVFMHCNVKSTPEAFLEIIAPYRDESAPLTRGGLIVVRPARRLNATAGGVVGCHRIP